MIGPDTLTAAIRLARAAEAWEPVVGAGMIPVLGAVGVFGLIRWAAKEPPGDGEPWDKQLPPPGAEDDGHEGPRS